MATILLLEDNPDMLAMLTQVLEWDGEHEVIGGRSGKDGVEALRGSDRLPQLIISDISMPEMDGFEFLKQVRTNEAWAHIPFVVMSARSSSEERRRAHEQGADDFLVKPFTLDDFQNILNKWKRDS